MVLESRIVWTVPGGGVGYSVFHHLGVGSQPKADAITTALRALITAVLPSIPNEVSMVPDSEVRELSTIDGSLISTWAVNPGAVQQGSNAGNFMGAAGLRVDADTNIIVAGRRLRGRTYWVPVASAAFSTGGAVLPAQQTLFVNAMNAFRASVAAVAAEPAVWSRTHGVAYQVSTYSVPALGAVLRSRRD